MTVRDQKWEKKRQTKANPSQGINGRHLGEFGAGQTHLKGHSKRPSLGLVMGVKVGEGNYRVFGDKNGLLRTG